MHSAIGPHDLIDIAEMPDDEAATAYALEVSSSGSVRATMMRAYDIASRS